MPKLTRVGSEVVFTQPGYTARLSTLFGAAPLAQYQTDNPARPVSVVSQPSGEGFQSLLDTGNDWTQSTATGLNANPIKRLDQIGSEYYGREEMFMPDRDGHEAFYQASMAGPSFWISVDREDDFIPPDARGEHRWSTKYHNILGFDPSHYHQLGTPLYFAGTPQVSSGLFMPGDTIKYFYDPAGPWWEKAAGVENGHIALRMRVSMKDLTGNGMAGFLFGIEHEMGPASDINTLWNAPWCGLIINQMGGMAFHDRNNPPVQFVPNNDPTTTMLLRTTDGILVDIRTLGTNKVEIYIQGALRGTFTRSCFGKHVAMFASCTSGRIAFRHRELFDMGANFICQYRTTPRNTLLQQLSVYRCRPPYTTKAYRINLPVVWIDPAIREVARIWNRAGVEIPIPPDGFPKLSDISAIYAGKLDGSAGCFGRIHGWTGSVNAHAGVHPVALGLNNLTFQANYSPEEFSHHVIVSEWAPKFRPDLLPPN